MSREEFGIFGFVALFAAMVLLGAIFNVLQKSSSRTASASKKLLGWLVLAALAAAATLWSLDNRDGWRSVEQSYDQFFALPGLVMQEPRWDHRWDNRCSSNLDQNRHLPIPIKHDRLDPRTRAALPDRLLAYLLDYHDLPRSAVSIEAGALDWRRVNAWDYDPDKPMFPERYTRITNEFVCARIDRTGDELTLAPCNPVRIFEPRGNAGYVLAVDDDLRDLLKIDLVHAARAPHWCENPVRRAVNGALGLDHPD